MILAGIDNGHEEQEKEKERWGLVWDPEEGPVWGNVGGTEGKEEEEDTWTQLLRGGVNGIIMDQDGEGQLRSLNLQYKDLCNTPVLVHVMDLQPAIVCFPTHTSILHFCCLTISYIPNGFLNSDQAMRIHIDIFMKYKI